MKKCECIEDFEVRSDYQHIDKIYEILANLETKIDVIGQKLYDLERVQRIDRAKDNKKKIEKELECINDELTFLENDFRDWFTGEERF